MNKKLFLSNRMSDVRKRPVLFLLILSWAAAEINASPTRDFIILADPSACRLLDHYEQPLPDAEKKALPPNLPFEIVKERQYMGDQITQAMRVSLLSTDYYILLDESGKISGLNAKSSPIRYKGCTSLNDTVVVAVSSLKLTSKYPSGGEITTVKKGETVIRIFLYKGYYYLFRPGPTPFFGWSDAPKSAFMIPLTKDASVTKDDYSIIHSRIMRRLEDANQCYDSMFLFFNRRLHQEKAIPKWQYSVKGNLHLYVLKGPEGTVRQLEESTKTLIGNIEYILLGKPYSIDYKDGIIKVRPQ